MIVDKKTNEDFEFNSTLLIVIFFINVIMHINEFKYIVSFYYKYIDIVDLKEFG